MRKDYKPSCLADVDMRQYRFERNSGLPRDYFQPDAWWRLSDDAIVFWVVLVAGIAGLLWSL
jgi:hypothetical protein